MTYPAEVQPSVDLVNRSRHDRLTKTFPKMDFEEKAKLLETYHPDFRAHEKEALRVGPNKGMRAPKEVVRVLESYSRLDPGAVDMTKADYRTDVLVIGSGGGGVTAALTAKKRGMDVLIATKLRLGDSNTIMAEGGIGAATEPDDSPVIHYIDTMVGGRYQNIPELVEALVTGAPFVLGWLTDLGVNFDRRPEGSYLTHMPAGHSRKRSHSIKDITGLEIMRVVCDEVRNEEILVLEFSPAVELVLDVQGRCAGAVLYNLDTGRHCLVQAKATILATGGMGRLHPQGFPTSNHYGATADGLVMAYRAGAKLIFLEFIQYHPTGIAWPEQMLGLLISEALRAQGAQVVNAAGDMFVDRLETRDALSAAIIRECGERSMGVVTPTGMLGVWLDTPLIDLLGGNGTFARRFAGIQSRFRKYNIDPSKEPILVYPTQHYQNGGVAINVHGETGVPNLYAVGEVAGGVHGHNRLGSNSLLDIFVFGRRAGEHVAEKTKEIHVERLALDHVRAYHKELEESHIPESQISPMLLPDYRFEKALTTVEHTKER